MEFDELIRNYAENNARLLSLKDICDADNKEIKQRFQELGETERHVPGYTARIVETRKEDFDEDKLLLILKSIPSCEALGIIKTIEYVDMDALEDAIYNSKIDAKSLVDAKTVKVYKRLTIRKDK